jgi:hypothetical protein
MLGSMLHWPAGIHLEDPKRASLALPLRQRLSSGGSVSAALLPTELACFLPTRPADLKAVVKAAGHPALVALTGNADGVGAAWAEALWAVDWSLSSV